MQLWYDLGFNSLGRPETADGAVAKERPKVWSEVADLHSDNRRPRSPWETVGRPLRGQSSHVVSARSAAFFVVTENTASYRRNSDFI